MGDRDEDYVPEEGVDMQAQEQESASRKSKVHLHTTVEINEATGKQKLCCKYCPKKYAYSGGNTSSLLQHFRGSHRDIPAVVSDFPENAEGRVSQAKAKRVIAQASIVEGIEHMKSMPPDHRVAVKITDCLADYCCLNNRTLDMVNDIGLIRVMAAANPRYQLYSRTYMTKQKLPQRYAAAVRSIRKVIDAQPGGWFTADLWSTENSPEVFLGINYHCLDEDFKYWCFTIGLQTFDERKTAEPIFSSWVLSFVEWGILTPIQGAAEFVNANGRLSIPDFMTHQKDLANAELNEGSDASTDEEMCL